MKAIPALPPADIELADRIEKLASYVHRNGLEFENKVKEKEAANPQFDFLFASASEGHYYYNWLLYCHRNDYTEDQGKHLSDAHAHKINYHAPQGILQLTDTDLAVFSDLMRSNDGSKDCIKKSRKWILERAHSIVHIGLELCRFSDQLAQENGPAAFVQLLHTAYVVNDVLYNAKGASSNGPYTRISSEHSPVDVFSLIAPYLKPLLVACCATAIEEAQRTRAFGLLTLWTKKEFISEEYSEVLKTAMNSATLPLELPESVPLVSPYVDDTNNVPANITNLPQAGEPPSGPQLPSKIPGISEAQLTQLQLIQQKIQAQLMQANNQQNQPPVLPHSAGQFPGVPPGSQGYSNQSLPFMQHPAAMMQMPPVQYAGVPMLDLAKIPVGNMANIVKAAKRAGHPPNTTIDIMMFAPSSALHVEPGRLEARLAAFYRNMEAIVNPQSAPGKNVESSVHGSSVEDHEHQGRRRQAGKQNEEEEGWEKYVPGYQDSRGDRDHFQPSRKLARISGEGNAGLSSAGVASEVMISEDNVGHKLLRGLGWQQGSGLGAEGAGIVEPISAKGAADRSGVGSAEANVPTLKDGSIDYSAYRKQLSSHYHTRMSER